MSLLYLANVFYSGWELLKSYFPYLKTDNEHISGTNARIVDNKIVKIYVDELPVNFTEELLNIIKNINM
jgi:hypothetical protein